MDPQVFISQVLVVLVAGLIAGVICKRLGVSLLVGYLVVGALIGNGALRLVTQEDHELEYLARAGALLLLFSIGIEFSLGELVRLSRYISIGGAAQMLLVAVPLTATCLAFGMTPSAAILAGSAGALSSTVLVFKALAEWGHSASPHGRRAIAILLFQDVALVPLMLLVPLLTEGRSPSLTAVALLIATSVVFVFAVVILRRLIGRWVVPTLAHLRSVELVVLFSLGLLCGVCWAAHLLGLPPAVGALAAGIMLSGNRLSKQIDTIVLPFRESFAAVFFVTLGTLLDPRSFLAEPLLLTSGLVGMLLLKTFAAAAALKLVGLTWRAAFGMGLGLAQLGEFSFLLLAQGVGHGVISLADYNRMLFVALGTLILTPQLLKLGLRWTDKNLEEPTESATQLESRDAPLRHALIIGIGPIGRQIASRLEIMGVDVCLVDLSPVNLYRFAQQGFHTVAGDARDPDVLKRAHVERCSLAVVSVPEDEAAVQIVTALREHNPEAAVYLRCRYQGNTDRLQRAGADAVVSEEAEASGALLKLCERHVGGGEVIP